MPRDFIAHSPVLLELEEKEGLRDGALYIDDSLHQEDIEKLVKLCNYVKIPCHAPFTDQEQLYDYLYFFSEEMNDTIAGLIKAAGTLGISFLHDCLDSFIRTPHVQCKDGVAQISELLLNSVILRQSMAGGSLRSMAYCTDITLDEVDFLNELYTVLSKDSIVSENFEYLNNPARLQQLCTHLQHYNPLQDLLTQRVFVLYGKNYYNVSQEELQHFSALDNFLNLSGPDQTIIQCIECPQEEQSEHLFKRALSYLRSLPTFNNRFAYAYIRHKYNDDVGIEQLVGHLWNNLCIESYDELINQLEKNMAQVSEDFKVIFFEKFCDALSAYGFINLAPLFPGNFHSLVAQRDTLRALLLMKVIAQIFESEKLSGTAIEYQDLQKSPCLILFTRAIHKSVSPGIQKKLDELAHAKIDSTALSNFLNLFKESLNVEFYSRLETIFEIKHVGTTDLEPEEDLEPDEKDDFNSDNEGHQSDKLIPDPYFYPVKFRSYCASLPLYDLDKVYNLLMSMQEYKPLIECTNFTQDIIERMITLCSQNYRDIPYCKHVEKELKEIFARQGFRDNLKLCNNNPSLLLRYFLCTAYSLCSHYCGDTYLDLKGFDIYKKLPKSCKNGIRDHVIEYRMKGSIPGGIDQKILYILNFSPFTTSCLNILRQYPTIRYTGLGVAGIVGGAAQGALISWLYKQAQERCSSHPLIAPGLGLVASPILTVLNCLLVEKSYYPLNNYATAPLERVKGIPSPFFNSIILGTATGTGVFAGLVYEYLKVRNANSLKA